MKDAPADGWIVVVARNIGMGADYVRTLGIPLSECLIVTPRTGLRMNELTKPNAFRTLLYTPGYVEELRSAVVNYNIKQFEMTHRLYWAANEDVELG